MVDVVDKATRSRMMSGIRGKNTSPELIVRKFLHAQGLRYKLHAKDLPGKPDLVFPMYGVVVFVHGCFWHRHSGCRYSTTPASNQTFWQQKFDDNVRRDREAIKKLKKAGWRVLVVWECDMTDKILETLLRKIKTME